MVFYVTEVSIYNLYRLYLAKSQVLVTEAELKTEELQVHRNGDKGQFLKSCTMHYFSLNEVLSFTFFP